MCGIAGFIEWSHPSAAPLEETARRMTAPLTHRGPDAGDVWVDAGVGIGHRRLSIIDLSSAGAQPMVSASGRLVISYNGEVYNAGELRAELEARGTRFRGHSDTEVVLEACVVWGVQGAVERLNGMFAFAVWDRTDRSLSLVRDRLGIKPLYYHADARRFAFASELGGLRAHPDLAFSIDREAVQAFLALDYIPAPFSIYREVRKLEPGSILRVDRAGRGQGPSTPYWTLLEAARQGHAERYAGTFEDAAEELDALLGDAVSRRMVADVPLGAFLSGGIDSSTVVALMQRLASRAVQTFSIGFAEPAFDEAPHARAIARHLGTDHCEHYVSAEEIREHGPAIMAHHDEPFADPSLLPTGLLSRLARSRVTVALSGDGGDENFGGYDRHIAAARLLAHPALGYGALKKALFRAALSLTPRPLRTRVHGLWEPAGGRRLSVRELGQLARLVHRPGLIHRDLAHGDSGRLPAGNPCARLVEQALAQCDFLPAAERQQYLDATGYLPDDVLTKVDRASMACSLEVRVPILDHRVVEFACRLPPAMKTDVAASKRILKAVLARHVPEPLFNRPKRGFGAPLGAWFSGPLRNWAADLLSTDALTRHGLVDPAAARATARRLHAGRIHRKDFRVIALAAWCAR